VSSPAISQHELSLPDGYALRAFRESDLQELHALVERNRDELARWLSWAQRPSVENTRGHLARALARARDGSGVACAVVLGGPARTAGESGPIVGDVGLYIDRANACASICYWLDAEHRGRGAMGFAVRSLVQHAFEQLALQRVEIRTDVRNRASRALAERLGFRLEGVLRQSYRIDDGRYSDDAVYSMLASDPQRAALTDLASGARSSDVATLG
jgi:ribosomal-protein-serine acetyltransferase